MNRWGLRAQKKVQGPEEEEECEVEPVPRIPAGISWGPCGYRPLSWQGQECMEAATTERGEGAHLVIVEDGIGHWVLPGHCGRPQLLHEEHLVGE